MLWDLLQQMQIGRAEQQATSVEARLAHIENQLERNPRVLTDLIRYLERRDGKDLDGDGRVG
jgi:hypothetical protein